MEIKWPVSGQVCVTILHRQHVCTNQKGVDEHNKRRGIKDDLEKASKKSFQAYERYLFVSGRKLALQKCKYYWLGFNRNKIKYVYKRKRGMRLKFNMGRSGREECIEQMDATEEHKILGIWLSPAGRSVKKMQTS